MTFCQVASSSQGDANKLNKMNGLEHGLSSWSWENLRDKMESACKRL